MKGNFSDFCLSLTKVTAAPNKKKKKASRDEEEMEKGKKTPYFCVCVLFLRLSSPVMKVMFVALFGKGK